MPGQWLKFTAFWSVFIGIVLFCVILGGYSSFWRSQSRIETSKSFLTDACQKRLDLLPGLIEMAENCDARTSIPKITQTAENATIILKQVIFQKKLLENTLIKEFEMSQARLTSQLKDLLTQTETCLDKNYSNRFAALKQRLNSAQDNLFVAEKTYNDEVNYFNTSATAFPSFLIAKLFGFNKIKYIKISKDLFLPARETFTSKTS